MANQTRIPAADVRVGDLVPHPFTPGRWVEVMSIERTGSFKFGTDDVLMLRLNLSTAAKPAKSVELAADQDTLVASGPCVVPSVRRTAWSASRSSTGCGPRPRIWH